MAALTAWGTPGEDKNATGFAIVTDDAEGGMIDVHDRRPVVFTANDAAAWMDPELSNEQAAELARSVALGPEKFAWHQVSKAVGNSRNQGAELVAPLARGLFD